MVTPSGVFFIRFHADRLVIRLKPMDGKMTVPQQHALFPNALSDVPGTINTQKRSIARRSRARWSRPARVRNVSLSKRLPLGVTKKRRRYGQRTQETRTGNCAASACSRATAKRA